ncbi:YfgM family protein [Comamonas flocculans]|uniref:Ancillary SecYEG translocon subunit n=1 Tax=Comamonas flocculans TaxID=2597701 RepID=A0A5B8RZ05_9BURK|nr:tetratricopeptide repeat protein [Comamonas flocculans]QEA13988.1 tetratricopeptide repeat protein [Comamonas flocculans]
MAHHFDLEEQEQIAQFKHFWDTWGSLITWAVIVVMGSLAAWNGYRYWQGRQAQQAVAMLDAVQVAAQAGELDRVQQILGDLRGDYPRTAQARQGALVAAQAFAKAQRWKDAQAALRWVVDKAGDEGYVALARLRLAAALVQEKDYDQALVELSGSFPPEFAAVVADQTGDVLQLQGKTAEAIAQYRRAYDALGEQLAYRQIVEAKLDALGGNAAAKEGA